MCFNETWSSYSLPDAHDTENILKVIGLKIKVTYYFSGGSMLIDGVLSKT